MKRFSTRTYRFLRALVLGVFRIIHPRVILEGKDNIPEGACILCSNHSAFSDPIWLVGYANLPKMPRVMAKQELSKVPVLSWFCKKLGCIFVNRDGNDLVAIKTAMKTLREGERDPPSSESVPRHSELTVWSADLLGAQPPTQTY